MGDVIKKSIKRNIIISIGCLLFIAIYSINFSMQWQNRFGVDERKIRIDFNTLVYQVEAVDITYKSTYSSISAIPFTLVGLDGTVLYSQKMSYQMGQQLNLHTLASINTTNLKYIVPVSHNGNQFGTLLIQFDHKLYMKPVIYTIVWDTPILFSIFIILFCFSLLIKVLKQDVFYPIKELHKTTKSIMGGNFNSSVHYDYEGDVGNLCHDFELMRSELQYSNLKEQSWKEKETLLMACISHDLKTPLASIIGYVEGILYHVVEKEEDIKNYASIILHKATLLNKLIDDILEHSKSQLNQFSIKKEELYAQPFFCNLLSELSQDASQKGLDFTYEQVPNVLLNIDPDRITQVMQNIIDNSIKYKKEPGKIHTSFHLEKDVLVVSVKDNGMGIAAADLPFVFDKFYRGDKARTQDIPGSGLGLNISRYIIEKHGGAMECDSILGVGTTISFSLNI